MLRKIAFLAVVCSPLFAKSQVSYDVKFDNGETKKVEFPYDDPDRLPRYNLTFDFFGFTLAGSDGMLTYQLKPEYRINKKMMVTANLNTVYVRKMDPSIGDHLGSAYVSDLKPTLDASALFHYSLFSLRNPTTKKVAVDYGGNSVYVARLPRVIAKTLLAEGGIYYMRAPSVVDLDNLDETQNDTGYAAINVHSLSFGVGLSYYHHESYEVKSNGISRSYFRYSRLYFHFTYALAENYDVQGIDTRAGYDNMVVFAATSGYALPTFSKIGWRFGFDKHMGIKNSNCTGNIGFELASVPYVKFDPRNGNPVKSPDQLFSIHFGIGFGAKPIKE